MLLDHESDKDKARRVAIGETCIAAAVGRGTVPSDAVDREAFAVDAVSDILTAVFGPRGAYTLAGDFVAHVDRAEAETLLRRAVVSWEGDSEDYTLAEEAVSDGQH